MMKLEAKKKHDPEPENAQIDINGKNYPLLKNFQLAVTWVKLNQMEQVR